MPLQVSYTKHIVICTISTPSAILYELGSLNRNFFQGDKQNVCFLKIMSRGIFCTLGIPHSNANEEPIFKAHLSIKLPLGILYLISSCGYFYYEQNNVLNTYEFYQGYISSAFNVLYNTI